MPLDLQPGGSFRVTVTKRPANEAAAKTLSRIFAKDPQNRAVAKHRRMLRRKATEFRRRGGRLWGVRPKAPRLVQPEAGAACTVFATCDVINDLNSVERFVEVAPA
jgi:hypothetical protein